MGRKSRQKRERKMERMVADPSFLLRELHSLQGQGSRKDELEKLLQERLKATREVLRRYRRIDAAIALSVSDLWPANAGSPIKHIFAWGVLLGLGPNDPDAASIASYEDLQDFAETLYAAWPAFPSLEDFALEADWGQTRVRLGSGFVPMFYGSCIERTPDFIEAFRITYADHPEAQAHMDLAVAMQAQLIKAIPNLPAVSVPELEPRHIEVPPKDFWETCRAALLKVGSDIAHWRQNAGTALEARFGAFKAPLTWNTFGNAVMQGTALPFLAVVEGNDWIPVSVRSGPSVVIDHWAAQHVARVSLQTHRRLARFVVERFRESVLGPLTPMFGEMAYEDLPVSCIISANSGVYLICACDHASSERVSRVARSIYSTLRGGTPIRFRFADGRVLMLSSEGGGGPSADELHILVVITQSSTALGSIAVPEMPTRMMPLADFITIFDSLEDLAELERYWKYVDEQQGLFRASFAGHADMFASFKDSHEVLVDGAMAPTLIMLDPHWGTSWRFRELETFWSRAPCVFPDGSSGWQVADGTEGVVELKSRHHNSLAYSTEVGACTVQTQIIISRDMKVEDGRMVDMFAQLLADSLYRCRELISDAQLFELPHVVFRCEPDPTSTIDSSESPEPLEKFPSVVISASQNGSHKGQIRLRLDVRAVLAGLNAASDGAFEVRCLVETLTAYHNACGMELPPRLAERLRTKPSEPARFHMTVVNRYVDVPDHVAPVIPSPTEYKLARKHLAVAMKELGLSPGRYELSDAKARIDPASERLRFHIESRLATLDRHELLQTCIEQHDALLIAERMKVQRTRQSLSHAVEYDRLEAVEDARKEFGSVARHYRYILEKVVSSPKTGVERVDDSVLRELIGLVDWYMVLTGASNFLHNGIDVGGVDIDDSFIPQVFYSSDSNQREEQFAREYAKSRLGIGINEQDVVEGASTELLSSQKIRQAFRADLGFELQHLLNALVVLSQAQRWGFAPELSLSYSADPARLAQVFVESVEGLKIVEACKVVEFLTLSEKYVRRLPGRDVDEIDVPYWEHNKRLHRYAIRPLIVDGAALRWGAEQASRTMSIWTSSVRDGYLPADFDWPSVGPAIREVKEGIEKRLEIRTEQIFQRHTPYVVRGLDFFKRFRSEGFDDVGDFDVLAYWPDTNTLVTVECKYNQPPYTMKDSRRLRDRIFGKTESDRAGQFSRILRRRQFVEKNRPQMLQLLNWPAATDKTQRDVELYVSREVHYWMIHPPYPVQTKFVRVDALDSWINNELIEPPEAEHRADC
nr:hypothetical protein [uncultured Pseudomonas sp.]